jgi:hypothetical protein
VVAHVCAHGYQPTTREMAAMLAEMGGLDEPYHHRTVSCRIHYAAAHGLLDLPLSKQERFIPLKHVRGFRAVYDDGALGGLPDLSGPQAACWEGLIGFVEENGYQPLYRELGVILGCSGSNVASMVKRMMRKGYFAVPDPPQRFRERATAITGVTFRAVLEPGRPAYLTSPGLPDYRGTERRN